MSHADLENAERERRQAESYETTRVMQQMLKQMQRTEPTELEKLIAQERREAYYRDNGRAGQKPSYASLIKEETE